eukprot:9136734-Pyramimonas_sp.AAC.1
MYYVCSAVLFVLRCVRPCLCVVCRAPVWPPVLVLCVLPCPRAFCGASVRWSAAILPIVSISRAEMSELTWNGSS